MRKVENFQEEQDLLSTRRLSLKQSECITIEHLLSFDFLMRFRLLNLLSEVLTPKQQTTSTPKTG